MDSPVDKQAPSGWTTPPAVQQSEDLNLLEVLNTLWRQRWLIFATITVITGAMLTFVAMVEPRYTAAAQILYGSNVGKTIDFTAGINGLPQDDAAVLGEMQVLKSRDLAQRVIDQLHLDDDAQFNEALRPKDNFLSRLAHVVAWRYGSNEDKNPDGAAQIQREGIVATFLEGLTVEQVGRSRGIDIKFTSTSPFTAASVANTLADLYLMSQLEDKFENARRSSRWLAEQSQKLRHEVEESERAAETYRTEHNLLEAERGTMLVEQISGLNAKLTEASIQRSEAEASLAQVRRMAASRMDLSSAAQVLDSNLYQKLREQEVALDGKEADLGNSLGERHPAILQLRAEKQKLQQNLAKEVAKIARRLENEVEVARRRESALTTDLDALKQELSSANRDAVGLHTLERDAEASRLLLDKFMTAFTETTAHLDADSQLPDARIISRAAIPTEPSFPPATLLVVFGFLTSSFLGVLFALGRELLDASYRNATQIQRDFCTPVLAHVPSVGKGHQDLNKLLAYLADHPASTYSDAVGAICKRVRLISPIGLLKTLVFVSSVAGEGKTSLATTVAVVQARAGQRVILIDSDIRCSSIARALNLSSAPGLLDVLSGACSIEEAIRPRAAGGADVLLSGKFTSDHVDQLAPEKLGALLQQLRRCYDLVIIDAPPVQELSDTQVIASVAELTVLVVEWGKTRKKVVQYAVEQLKTVGANIVGIAYNKVDIRKLSQYQYGEAGCYYGRSGKYFSAIN